MEYVAAIGSLAPVGMVVIWVIVECWRELRE
jgi:hypothetical protein